MKVVLVRQPLFPPLSLNIRRGHSFTQVDFADEHPLQAMAADHFQNLCSVLALTRRRKEGIQIGDNIFLNVAKIKTSKVVLAIKAPDEHPIFKLDTLGQIQIKVSDPKPGQRPKKIRWNLEKLQQVKPQIVITVVANDRGKIRLGFEAPDRIEINRNELLTGDPTVGTNEIELQGEVDEPGFGLILVRQVGEKIGIWAPDPSFSINYKEPVSRVH